MTSRPELSTLMARTQSGYELDVTKLLAHTCETLMPGVPTIIATSAGDPAEEIVRYAAGHRVDLIVLGTHGRTGVSRVLLGSVAERVLRTAHCPVLVVPGLASTSTRRSPAHAFTRLDLPTLGAPHRSTCSPRPRSRKTER